MNVAGALSDLIAIHRVAPGEAGSHLCAAILMASAAWRFSRAILSLLHLCTAQGWSPECGRSSSRSSAHKRQARQTCAAVGVRFSELERPLTGDRDVSEGSEPDVNSEAPGSGPTGDTQGFRMSIPSAYRQANRLSFQLQPHRAA